MVHVLWIRPRHSSRTGLSLSQTSRLLDLVPTHNDQGNSSISPPLTPQLLLNPSLTAPPPPCCWRSKCRGAVEAARAAAGQRQGRGRGVAGRGRRKASEATPPGSRAASCRARTRGPVTSQDTPVEAVALAADEIVASARAKQVAVLATELGQLRVKIFTLGAC